MQTLVQIKLWSNRCVTVNIYDRLHGCYMHTVFTLSIRTPQLLTIYVLKFEPVQFTTRCYV